MARIRTIKPEAFRSRTIKKLSFPARWTFEGLVVHADDEGRVKDDIDLIRADIYPLEMDEVSVKDVESHIQEMVDVEMLCRYQVNGTWYLHFVNFKKHQRINRPSESHLPGCPYHEDDGSPKPGAKPPSPKFTEPPGHPHAPLSEGAVSPQPSRVRAGSGSGGEMEEEEEKELAPLASVTVLLVAAPAEEAAAPQGDDGSLFAAPPPAAPAKSRGGKKPKAETPKVPKSPEQEAMDKLADGITRNWYDALNPKPRGSYVGRMMIVRELVGLGHNPDDLAEAAKRCGVGLTGPAMELHLAKIAQQRVVPIQRQASAPIYQNPTTEAGYAGGWRRPSA